MKYTLRIIQQTENGREETAAEAEGGFSGGRLVLGYAFDGARYSLTLAKDFIRHTRSGEVSLDMRFAEGERSVCTVGHGGSDGFFEIVTNKLKVNAGSSFAAAECEFSSPDGGNLTKMIITASVIN